MIRFREELEMKLNFAFEDNLPVSIDLTVRELKIIEEVFTASGDRAGWTSHQKEAVLHKEIRKVLLATSNRLSNDATYMEREYGEAISYSGEEV
jgi:hypothetical protein